MSQAGILNSGSTPPPPSGQVLVWEVSPEIDFKVTGLTTVFTTPSNQQFMPIAYSILTDSYTGIVAPGIYNLGITGPNYDDYASTAAGPFSTTTNNFVPTFFDQNDIPVVPISTPVKVNVTQAANATTATGRIFVMGFYF